LRAALRALTAALAAITAIAITRAALTAFALCTLTLLSLIAVRGVVCTSIVARQGHRSACSNHTTSDQGGRSTHAIGILNAKIRAITALGAFTATTTTALTTTAFAWLAGFAWWALI
jgi:hypothetical protein